MMMVITETRRPHLIIYLQFYFTSMFRHLKMLLYNRKKEIELNKRFHIKYQNKIGTSLSCIYMCCYIADKTFTVLAYMSYKTGALVHPRFLGGVRVSHLFFFIFFFGFLRCVFFFYFILFVSALCFISNVACV